MRTALKTLAVRILAAASAAPDEARQGAGNRLLRLKGVGMAANWYRPNAAAGIMHGGPKGTSFCVAFMPNSPRGQVYYLSVVVKAVTGCDPKWLAIREGWAKGGVCLLPKMQVQETFDACTESLMPQGGVVCGCYHGRIRL